MTKWNGYVLAGLWIEQAETIGWSLSLWGGVVAALQTTDVPEVSSWLFNPGSPFWNGAGKEFFPSTRFFHKIGKKSGFGWVMGFRLSLRV